MSFKLGPKVLIVNDPAAIQLLYYAKLASGIKRLVETDDDFQTTTAFDDLVATPDTQSGDEGAGYLPATPADDETIAQADFLRILGFGDFDRADVTKAIGTKGAIGVKQISTLTITGTPANVVGKELEFKLEYVSDNFEAEFATYSSDYKKPWTIIVPIKAADTVTTIADRFVAQLASIVDSGQLTYVTATNAAGVITVTSTKATLQFSVTISGSALSDVAVAFATTTAGFGGRNTWEQLKGIRLQTVNGVHVEEAKTDQVPLVNAKYSAYTIKKTVSRPDLAGFGGGLNDIPSGSFDFTIYLNESTCATHILNLTKWLNANVANRTMYASATAAAILGGDPATEATTLDATEPFTTPLV